MTRSIQPALAKENLKPTTTPWDLVFRNSSARVLKEILEKLVAATGDINAMPVTDICKGMLPSK